MLGKFLVYSSLITNCVIEYKGKCLSIIDDITKTVYDNAIIVNNNNFSVSSSDYSSSINSKNMYVSKNLYTAKDINVYVIDSGIINNTHEYSNRILQGYNVIDQSNDTTDYLGHGTHVSSIIASKSYGITESNIIPVKVFDHGSSTTVVRVLHAIVWILKQKKGIVNISLNGESNSVLDEYINHLVDAGFIVVSSAGNHNDNACNYSPKGKSIIVGCVDDNNEKCMHSNYGSCISVYARGNGVYGNGIYHPEVIKSGTSMSAAYVSGIAAMLLERYPTITQELVMRVITMNKVAKIYNDPGPMCNKKGVCSRKPLCKMIKKYGCRPFHFCNFKTKRECLNRKRCKFSKKCMLK